jgi:uroporphyrinogen-III synthase
MKILNLLPSALSILIMTNVLLLRNPSADTPDRYHEFLESLGFVPHSIPVLDTALTGIELMKEVLLNNSSDYDGVIITSSRAAETWRLTVERLIHTADPHASEKR